MDSNKDLGKHTAMILYNSAEFKHTSEAIVRRVIVPYLQRIMAISNNYENHYYETKVHGKVQGVVFRVKNTIPSKGITIGQFAKTEKVNLARLGNQVYFLESLCEK
ncbi:MAG: hypothetical protein AABX03_02870 [Nanoarchaeota archaeon]